MSIDLTNVIQKGTHFAEQATLEDQKHNYEVAAGHYMAAADWFIHATKYGTMNDETKKRLRAKVATYLKRAEEIKNISNKKPSGRETVPNNHGGNERSKTRQDCDEDNDDPDKRRMMQKFEGAIITNPEVTFDNVVGLDQAKNALKEAVILPVKYPKLFRGKCKPWAGILLYGPPGTGKSYLAKAIATECKSTFISVSSSDILTKWLGDSEKGVKCLFELARKRQPCIVFIDEIDALCGQRDGSGSEASSRVITEFLVQMQGVGTDNSGVLVLGATNIPWSLDTAIRRRFEKRIYIPLPGVNERAAMFKTHLGTNTYHTIKDNEWMQLAQRAEHYSGADIGVVCREALLRPIRRISSATHFKQVPNLNRNADEPTHLWFACSPGDTNAKSLTLEKIDPDELGDPPVSMSDMSAALSTQKATVGVKDLIKYEQFTEEFGQEDIPNNKSNTSFDDIIGLTNAKTALFEAIILPAKFPKLFQDKDTLVTSILLYGWPGIGKTLLAKAVATECNIPFISVDAWQFATKNDDDDGGKLADRCFQLAREQQPSLLFIDNIDCLFSDDGDQTDDKSYQHIKTEFLMQMDNIQKQNGNIFILATINQPWLLTSAIQQKFHKRIYLPLPNLNERVALFKMHFDSTINYTIDEHDWIKLAEKTENYSPADITCVCREALFRPIRQVTSATHFKQVRNPKSDGTAQLWFICSSVDPAAEVLTFDQIEPHELYLPPFDMLTALDTTKHSISDADIAEYEKFAKENP
ncbi:hypothetical protein I4U23_020771 [Adineta vaga]|nr:hypothetical protein I4U23_020771 [Adineta vaga]